MPKTPNYAAQFDEQPADESDDFKRVFGGVKVPKGLQPGSNELTALEWLRKSPTSLTIDVDLTEEEWHTLIASIETIKKRYQWYLGDAMVYGINRSYGATSDQIQRVVEVTGKDEKTLHDYYKTALLFEMSERSELLEFEQHRVIQRAFSEDTPEHRAERLRWLHVAETEKMSGRKLTAEIATAKLPAPSPSDDIEDDEPPSPSEEKEPLIVVHNSPLKAKEHRQRFVGIWKKVEDDIPMTDEDLGELFMHRAWVDMLIEREQKRK